MPSTKAAAGRKPAAVRIRVAKSGDPPTTGQIGRLLELRARKEIPAGFAFQMSVGWPPQTAADAQALIMTLEQLPTVDTAKAVRLKARIRRFLDRYPGVGDYPPGKTRALLMQAWDMLADVEEVWK